MREREKSKQCATFRILAEVRPCLQIFFTEIQHKNFHFALSHKRVLVAFACFVVVVVVFLLFPLVASLILCEPTCEHILGIQIALN